MSGLVIDITELAGKPGAVKTISRSEPVPGLRGALGRVEEDRGVEVSLVAESLIDGVAVSGQVAGTMHLSCSRCLVEYEESFRQEVDEVFYFQEADEKEGYAVEGTTIDLEPMLRDVIVLAIPTRPLHREDCRGICAVCGADLNARDCGHREEPDLRWAPLRGLLAAYATREES